MKIIILVVGCSNMYFKKIIISLMSVLMCLNFGHFIFAAEDGFTVSYGIYLKGNLNGTREAQRDDITINYQDLTGGGDVVGDSDSFCVRDGVFNENDYVSVSVKEIDGYAFRGWYECSEISDFTKNEIEKSFKYSDSMRISTYVTSAQKGKYYMALFEEASFATVSVYTEYEDTERFVCEKKIEKGTMVRLWELYNVSWELYSSHTVNGEEFNDMNKRISINEDSKVVIKLKYSDELYLHAYDENNNNQDYTKGSTRKYLLQIDENLFDDSTKVLIDGNEVAFTKDSDTMLSIDASVMGSLSYRAHDVAVKYYCGEAHQKFDVVGDQVSVSVYYPDDHTDDFVYPVQFRSIWYSHYGSFSDSRIDEYYSTINGYEHQSYTATVYMNAGYKLLGWYLCDRITDNPVQNGKLLSTDSEFNIVITADMGGKYIIPAAVESDEKLTLTIKTNGHGDDIILSDVPVNTSLYEYFYETLVKAGTVPFRDGNQILNGYELSDGFNTDELFDAYIVSDCTINLVWRTEVEKIELQVSDLEKNSVSQDSYFNDLISIDVTFGADKCYIAERQGIFEEFDYSKLTFAGWQGDEWPTYLHGVVCNDSYVVGIVMYSMEGYIFTDETEVLINGEPMEAWTFAPTEGNGGPGRLWRYNPEYLANDEYEVYTTIETTGELIGGTKVTARSVKNIITEEGGEIVPTEFEGLTITGSGNKMPGTTASVVITNETDGPFYAYINAKDLNDEFVDVTFDDNGSGLFLVKLGDTVTVNYTVPEIDELILDVVVNNELTFKSKFVAPEIVKGETFTARTGERITVIYECADGYQLSQTQQFLPMPSGGGAGPVAMNGSFETADDFNVVNPDVVDTSVINQLSWIAGSGTHERWPNIIFVGYSSNDEKDLSELVNVSDSENSQGPGIVIYNETDNTHTYTIDLTDPEKQENSSGQGSITRPSAGLMSVVDTTSDAEKGIGNVTLYITSGVIGDEEHATTESRDIDDLATITITLEAGEFVTYSIVNRDGTAFDEYKYVITDADNGKEVKSGYVSSDDTVRHLLISEKIGITSVNPDKEQLELTIGDQDKITAEIKPADTTEEKTLTWVSNDDSIVTVDAEGNVKAVGIGEAVITVTAVNGVSAQVSVKVSEKEHSWGEWKVTKAPTCTEAGTEERECSVCGEKETRTVEALGHKPADPVKENEVAATCTKEGSYDEVVYCSVCHEELSREHKTVTAFGHTWSEWKQAKAPTCTEAGAEERECSVCGEKETRVIDALGHKPAEIVKENEVAATCTKEGSYDEVVYCSVCGAELSREHKTVAALGHTWSEWKQTKDPACEEAGEETRECSVCHEKETRTVEALSHIPTDPVKENEVAATCTKEGSYDEVIYCSVCGAELSREHKTVAALGHTWGEWKETKAPTCEEAGEETRECFRCNLMETRAIDALGHDWGEWISNGELEKTHSRVCSRDPEHVETEKCDFETFTATNGSTVFRCKICGNEFSVPDVCGCIYRLAGSNRFGTSMAIADEILQFGIEKKYDTVILANGDNFADALGGSYLAAVKGAPIIITRTGKESEVNSYIRSILNEGGKIYVLGGKNAVTEGNLKGLTDKGYSIERLEGSNRYGTNLAILEEAGLNGDTILVATGINYADSLSASATGKPILLVNNSLNDDQISYLKEHKGCNLVILGGTLAVSNSLEKQLSAYGKVNRVSGSNRFATSIAIARRFFDKPRRAVIAYGRDFPDGLCGGPLAYRMNAPLLLTDRDAASVTGQYCHEMDVHYGYALGGKTVLTDETIKQALDAHPETNVVLVSE